VVPIRLSVSTGDAPEPPGPTIAAPAPSTLSFAPKPAPPPAPYRPLTASPNAPADAIAKPAPVPFVPDTPPVMVANPKPFVVGTPGADKRNRTKYECPGCKARVWGKPKLRLQCLECRETFSEKRPT
jgi:hypothetical protein